MMFAQMIKLLMTGPHTFAELAEETGAHYITVREWVREMHRQGIVRVSTWVENRRGARVVEAFVLGEGPDCRRPAPKSGRQRTREYIARKAAREAPSLVARQE
jgi:DNA-binding Lrp family transcriptional regulator